MCLIIVVEGKTDHAFIERAMQLALPERRVTVISSGGDVKKKIHGLREAFGELDKSPFKDRLFVVLDSIHQPGLHNELTKLGVKPGNIVTWSKNRIEYMYPAAILQGIFACNTGVIESLSIIGDLVSLNGISKTKADLATEVISRMQTGTVFHEEFTTRLLTPVSNSIG